MSSPINPRKDSLSVNEPHGLQPVPEREAAADAIGEAAQGRLQESDFPQASSRFESIKARFWSLWSSPPVADEAGYESDATDSTIDYGEAEHAEESYFSDLDEEQVEQEPHNPNNLLDAPQEALEEAVGNLAAAPAVHQRLLGNIASVWNRTKEWTHATSSKVRENAAAGSNKVREGAAIGLDKAANTLIATLQVSELLVAETLRGVGKAVVLAKSTPNLYIDFYANHLGADKLIEAARQRIRQATNDEELIILHDFFASVIVSKLKPVLEDEIKKNWNAYLNDLQLPSNLVEDLLRINLANIFANLAEQSDLNRDQIPHYDQQSSLVNIVALFCQRIAQHVSLEELEAIENLYQPGSREKLLEALDPLFIEDSPATLLQTVFLVAEEDKATLLQKLTENIHRPLTVRSILKKLIPNYDELAESQKEKVNQLVELTQKQVEQAKLFDTVFNEITDDVMTLLLPRKVDDVVLPLVGVVQRFDAIKNYVYTLVRQNVAQVVRDNYSAIRKDPVKMEAWTQSIQARVGTRNVSPLVEAPAVLLYQLGRTYIQSDPQAIATVSEFLRSLKPLSEPQPVQQRLLSEMGDEQLANVMLTSGQALLNTDDPDLLRAGFFIKEVLQNLTLSLLAKGTELLIPEGEIVAEDQFLKQLLDRFVNRATTFAHIEEISEEEWKGVTQDLPLPAAAKDFLATKLAAQSSNLQQSLEPFRRNQTNYQAALAQLHAYPGGDQLLSLVKKVTDKVVDEAFKNNENLITASGLSDSLDDLLAQYLPGIEIDENLKTWFRNNITAFGEDPSAIHSVNLLKDMISGFLVQALAKTIETNFKNRNTDFVTQLMRRMRDGFNREFPRLNAQDKERFAHAALIQAEISRQIDERKIAQAEIDAWKFDLVNLNMHPDITTNFQNLLGLQTKLQAGELRAAHLQEELGANLALLSGWNTEKLEQVKEALAWQKAQLNDQPLEIENLHVSLDLLETALVEEQRSYAQLTMYQDKHQAQIRLNSYQNAIQKAKMLLTLLELPADQLEIVKESVVLQDALALNIQENYSYQDEIQERKNQLLGRNALSGEKEGAKAKALMQSILEGQAEVAEINADVAQLGEDLDGYLESFQTLADEFLNLMGWKAVDQLSLPFLSAEHIDHVTDVMKKQAARLLFEQLSPMMLTYFDRRASKKVLRQATGSDFLVKLCATAAKEAIDRMPALLTYHVAAQQLANALSPDVSKEQVEMLNQRIGSHVKEAGTNALNAGMVKGLLRDIEKKENDLNRLTRTLVHLAKAGQLNYESVDEALGESATPELIVKVINAIQDTALKAGRDKLAASDLLAIYQEVVGEAPKEALELIEEGQIVQAVQSVATSPAEIAYKLNAIIPGAEDLQTLFAPQIQNLLLAKNQVDNRLSAQNYLESFLLKFFTGVVNKNGKDNFFNTLTEKLKVYITPQLTAGLPPERVAEVAVGRVLREVIGITNKDDLKGVPPALQQVVYDLIVEQSKVHLSPLIMPIIAKQIDRETLNQISKSSFLSNLCGAIAKDAVAMIPVKVQSYQTVARRVYETISRGKVNPEKLQEFTNEIALMVKRTRVKLDDPNAEPVHIKNRDLFDAYERVVRKKPYTEENRAILIKKLKETQAKEEVNAIMASPEEIAEALAKALPNAQGAVQQELASQLQAFIQSNGVAYQNLSAIVEHFVEGLLLKSFIRIAKKNKPTANKDVLVVLTEKLLETAKTRYQELQTRPADQVIPELVDEVLQKILGIDSDEPVAGLPRALQATAYELIKEQVTQQVQRAYDHVHAIGHNQQLVEAKADLNTLLSGATAEVVARDIGDYVVESTLATLNTVAGSKLKGVTAMTEAARTQMDTWASSNLEIIKVLQSYGESEAVEKSAEGALKSAQKMGKLERAKAAQLVADVVLPPLNRALSQLVQLEDEHQERLNQDLITGVMQVAAEHFEIAKAAKALAALRGEDHFNDNDYVQAAGEKLHAAVPKAELNYQKVIDQIRSDLKLETLEAAQIDQLKRAIEELVKKNGDKSQPLRAKHIQSEIKRVLNQSLTLVQAEQLKDLMLAESTVHTQQRIDKFFQAGTEKILKVLFPNGRQDLTFVPPEYRKQVWKLLKNEMGPIIVPIIIESLFDQDNITQIVDQALQATQDNLEVFVQEANAAIKNPKAVKEQPAPIDGPLDALDQSVGALLGHIIDLNQTKLPQWIINKIKDPKTGALDPAMQKLIGNSIRKQFNADFIKRNLKIGLESAATRDASGKPTIYFDPSYDKAGGSVRKEARIEAAMHKVVETSISYSIRSAWASVQKKWGDWIERKLGRLGPGVRKVLDSVMRHVFSSIVFVLFKSAESNSLRPWVKSLVDHYIQIDANRKMLMDIIRKSPKANEDMVYKLLEAMEEAIVKNQTMPASEG
jgi:hypothetical protein